MTVHRRLVLAIILAFAYWMPHSAFAQISMTSAVQVSTALGAHSPAMHVGRDGAVYVSWFQANADIYFSRSTDQGQTFATPVRVCRQVTTNQYTSLLQRAPEFAIDTKGVIHLVWTEARVTSASDVWYVHSTDSGKTWTPPLSIMDPGDSANYSQDFSAIACDSSDNLYVSFLDNRYIMAKTGKHYRMHIERSTNGGQTWSLPVIADKLPADTSGTCECCRQDIAASPEGHVYIAFRTNMTTPTGDKRDIFICRSWDGGRTFDSSIRCQLGGWTLDACPTKGPHISLDLSENLFIAWNDARDDMGKLVAYFDMLPKGWNSVLPNYSISNSNSQTGHWPYVAVSPTGLIAYAYMPGESLGGPIQFTYSSDGGNTWNQSRALPGSAGDNQSLPELAFDARGHVYAVWQDGAANGIMCSAITGLNIAVAPTKVGLPPLFYNIGPIVQLYWLGQSKLRLFTWYKVIVSSGGAVVFDSTVRDTSVTLLTLSPGNYNYTIIAHTVVDSSVASSSFRVGALGVNPGEQYHPVSIAYPNPARSGMVTVSLPDAKNIDVSVAISDGSGRIVRNITSAISDGELVLNLQSLASGTYQIQITQGANRWNVPIILNN